MTTLYIIREIFGPDKTTFVKISFLNIHHYEADDYPYSLGTYQLNAKDLPKTHKQCFEATEKSLKYKVDVVVSDTFTTIQEMLPYIKLAKTLCVKVVIITRTTQYKNIHRVPEKTIQKQKDRFVSTKELKFSKLLAPYQEFIRYIDI